MTEIAVLFDLDGTLIDTAPDFIAVANLLRTGANNTPVNAADMVRKINGGAAAMAALTFGVETASEAQRQAFLDQYTQTIGQHAKLYPGFERLLAELETHGIAWGIVTNKPKRFTDKLLATLKLQPQAVVCGDEVKSPKPHPESLQLAASLMGVDAQHCIYCGDHERDVLAARNAGMHAYAASYGYLEDNCDPAQWNARAVAASSQQLAQLIRDSINSIHPNLMKYAS